MNIVVCTKQTPDTAAKVEVKEGHVTWGEAALVVNPWDEYAIEEALRLKEKHSGKVTALTMGPESAKEARSVIGLYRDLLAGKTAGKEVWQRLQASNRVGVTRGTLEERRNPLAIL